MKHLEVLYYVLSYSLGLPTAVVVLIALARGRSKVLRAFLPLLLTTTLQLLCVAVLRYQSVILAPSLSVSEVKQVYFALESTLVFTLPFFCHALAGSPGSVRARNILFGVLFVACLGTVLSPLALHIQPDTGALTPRAGFYVYRGIFYATALYSMIVVLTRFRRLATPRLKVIATASLVSMVLSLWETLHCELFPVLGHVQPDIPLSPTGYVLTSLAVLFFVIREYLLPKPPAASPAEDVLRRGGVSDREKEIVLLLQEGHRIKDIGERLFISSSTVKTHVKSIYRKLDVGSRVQLVNRLQGRADDYPPWRVQG